MSTQATNTTPHYHLSQWEPDDHILRTDFNADFAIIDQTLYNQQKESSSAVAAAEEKIALLRLAEAKLDTAAASLSMDLSAVDLSRYVRLELQISGIRGSSSSAQNLYLLVNGDNTDGNYCSYGKPESYDTPGLSCDTINNSGNMLARVLLADLSGQLAAECHYLSYDEGSLSGSGDPVFSLWKQGGLAAVRTLTLKAAGGNLQQGLCATLYGWRA